MPGESSEPPLRPCVFISAVSRELADARLLVANCLRVFHDVDVYYQEEFGMEPGELRAMLRTKIDESAGVLQLVGEAYGAAPPDEDPEFGPVSFTQYEFLYAQKQGKVTWLIDVGGGCTRAINVAEFVLTARPDSRSMELEKRYLSRLRTVLPGGQLVARAGDDDDLKQVIAEHTKRRELQRNYVARNHAHLRGRADDDDQLVDIVRVLQRVPRVAPRCGFVTAHLGAALHERFVGRAALTYAVLFLLRQPGSSRQKIVLYGLDGSGKTTVATEIGHVYHKTGHDVLVVRPVPGRDLDGDIASLAEPLGLPDTAGAPRVREWLRRHADWLVIFDGVDDVETAGRVEQFCSQFHDGHFLITSSLAGYWGSRQQFVTREVDTLGTRAAYRLLLDLLSRGSRPPDPAEDLLALTRLLDGLPLAILHANGYLERNPGHSIKAYIARLQSAPVLPDSGPDSLSAPSTLR